jgi:predicted PurR-regulated permease PerM
VGESVGLHPVWLILSLAVGGYFFGFVGLLLAVPVAVLVKLLLTAALGRYRNSPLFLGSDTVRLDPAEPSDAQLTST